MLIPQQAAPEDVRQALKDNLSSDCRGSVRSTSHRACRDDSSTSQLQTDSVSSSLDLQRAHIYFCRRCTGVSKQWRVFINSLPKLWTQVDLSESRRSVKNAFLSHCINTSKHQVSSATLKRLATPDKAITALVRSCRSLQTLKLIDGGLISPDLIHQLQSARKLSCLVLGTEAPISLDTATLLLRDLPTLVQLECHHIEHRGNLSYASWKGEYPKLQRLKLVSGMQNTSCPSLHIVSRLRTAATFAN